MRLLLVAAILAATPAAAGAGQAEADAYSAQQAAYIASRVKATEQGIADRKALCARVGGPRIGQSAAGVLASCWGKPARVNTTQTAAASVEQWVYRSGYVYLTNGTVTAIQTSR